jgi:uncharacterized delta-60 repeat protein
MAATVLGKGEMMSKRLLLCVVFLTFAVSVVGVGSAAAARPGNVDSGFGVGGTVVQPRVLISASGFYGPFGEDMAIGGEDAIYVLQSERECRSGEVCSRRFFVERYSADGTADPGYGSQGRSASVTVAVPGGPSTMPYGDRLASIAVTSDDEVLVATVDAGRFSLFRLDASGRLSAGFGSSGRVTTDFGGIAGRPQLAILADGRFLVAGTVRRSDGASFVVLARFGANGALDPSFGSGLPEAIAPGVLAIPAPSAATMGSSPGGRIVMGGVRCCLGKGPSVFFGRRDADGRPLPPFAPAEPWRNLKMAKPFSVSAALALPGGRIGLVGWSKAGPFVARLKPSGRRDRGFGRNGVVRLGGLGIGVSPALVDTAGNIYVAGHRGSGEEYVANRGVVARVTKRGRVDRRFGSAPPGYALLPRVISEPLAMGFQSSGKLVVFGEYSGDCIRSCLLPGRVLTRLYTSRRQGP